MPELAPIKIKPLATVIVPVWNGEAVIGQCLACLSHQETQTSFEILVIDDGSTDHTCEVVAQFPSVKLIRRTERAGPAVARNQGAATVQSEVLLFTDADCRPCPVWVEEMTRPFRENPSIAGTRGAYGTDQTALVARLIQAEYDHRYRMLKRLQYVDYIGGYSAGYRRDVFLAAGGFSLAFSEASSEDGDLSYRLARDNHLLVFSPKAVVLHKHPDTLSWYWRRKFKYSFWRMLAYRRNPSKMIADSHTPQLMKLQALTPPALVLAVAYDLAAGHIWAAPIVAGAFVLSVLPFSGPLISKNPAVAAIAPIAFFGRAVSHFTGATLGTLNLLLKRAKSEAS